MIISRVVVTVLVLVLGIGLAAWMVISKGKPAVKPPGDPRPVARVATIERGEIPVDLHATGVVRARGRLTLVAEVAGRVAHLAPTVEAGIAVPAGTELLRIEDIDARAARDRAAAQVAAARLALAQEEALATQAAADWKLLGDGDGSDLALRQPQLAAARAKLVADEAALAQAERDLERCRILAPRDSVIEARQVEVGQVVAKGQALLRLRDRGDLEADLDVAVADLARIGIDPRFTGEGPNATLVSEDGRSAAGRIVRCTGLIDEQTRRLTLVVALDADSAFLPGDFVTATIHGRSESAAAKLPRNLLRRDDTVLLVGADRRLIEHPVTVLHLTREDAIVADDLPAGADLILNRLEGWSAGTEVRIAGAPSERPAPVDPATDAAPESRQ